MENKEKNIRNTRQKKYILDVLIENSSKHLSAEDIFELVKKKDENIGIATVYRNLKLLCKADYIKKVFISKSPNAFYEISLHSDNHSHHHLICNKCNTVIDFDDDLLEAIEKIIEVTKGFEISDHRVSFYGICKNCKNK